MVTIDASVWVAADAADEVARDEAQKLLRLILAARLPVHQPMLSIVEVVAAIARRTHNASLGREAGRRMLTMPGLVVHPLDLDAAAEAAALAGHLLLRAADAVYAATARRHGTELVTLDVELLERASAVVKSLSPAEWLARNTARL